MREKHYKREFAIAQTVADMKRRFVYPDEDTKPGPPFIGSGGGGMAHILIVSTSEPQNIQDKADFVVPQSNSASQLQAIFDQIDTQDLAGAWSIWMAGVFDLNSDVTTPNGAWIRGLGYTSETPVVAF